MIERRIPIAPDTSTTLTDETTEHIVNRKVTIKIDRDYLKKKYAELYKQLAKVAEKYAKSTNTACYLWSIFHQPKMPASLVKKD